MTCLCLNKPSKRDELTYAPIVHMVERFAPLVDQEIPKEEFEDYQLMEDTEIDMEEGGVQKYVDRYWGEIMKIKTGMKQMRFPSLAQVMIAVFQTATEQC